MRLQMLGRLSLEPTAFHRPKPLLLLAYLAVEGAKEKRHLYELFWPDAAEPATSLRVAISQLRKVSPELIHSDERSVNATVAYDLEVLRAALSRQDAPQIEALYRGGFLQGFSLPDWGAELEEWVYTTREFVAARVRQAYIRYAETEAQKGEFQQAVTWAEKAYTLGSHDLEPEELEHLYPLLVAGGSSLVAEARKQVKEFGLELSHSPEESRARYFVANTSEPQATRHNLPRSKTSFVGRDPELVELGQMLGRPEIQLITLLGPGGMGKTRLALQLAYGQLQEDSFPNGVYFIALEALSEPEQIISGLAQTLHVKLSDEPFAAVKEAIGEQHLLLVLDNFEHLVEGALQVSELLEACPHLKIVVTSRERLNLEEEHVLPLQGLPIPKETNFAEAEYLDAVKLFVQRAKRTRIDFQLSPESLPAVLEICQLVEGSPLGIELATVWLRSLSVAELAQEIRENVGALGSSSRNINQRHQSLRAVFEHSWKLLKPKEQQRLARLSVFRGGFTREAAGVVADTNLVLLGALVDKSLLRLAEGGGRYDFHPLLYQYASEKLAEIHEEKASSQSKHAAYFLELAETSRKAGLPAQIRCCNDEYENLLIALNWTQENDQASMGLRLGAVLGQYWHTQANYSESSHWLNRILSHPDGKTPTEERLGVLLSAARLSETELSQRYEDEALMVVEALERDDLKALAFQTLCLVAHEKRKLEKGNRYAEAGLELARKLGDEALLARALYMVGGFGLELNDLEKTQTKMGEALALYRKLEQPHNVGYALANLGAVAWMLGDLEMGKTQLEEALVIAKNLPDQNLTIQALSNLSGVMQDLGDLESAQTLARQTLEFRWKHRNKLGLSYSFGGIGNLAVDQGDLRRATRLWGATERLLEELNTALPPIWQGYCERFMATAKTRLDEAGFKASWQEGRRMGLEEAVQYALETTQVTTR